MSDRLIVGVVMVRDEDVWVDRAVRNALDAVDVMVLADHLSNDRTPEILQQIASEYPHKASYHRVEHAGDANVLLRDYVGEPVWVLGVDGDDLYEPARLTLLRSALLRGDYDRWYSIKGHTLHCTEYDIAQTRATGYTSPPARSVTKLFNFGAIERWTGKTHEHFYGGNKQFRDGYDDDSIYYLKDAVPWDDSPFRLLHMCFTRRSSLQPDYLVARRSVAEHVVESRLRRFSARAQELIGHPPNSQWKLNRYRQGELVTYDVSGFLAVHRARDGSATPRN